MIVVPMKDVQTLAADNYAMDCTQTYDVWATKGTTTNNRL